MRTDLEPGAVLTGVFSGIAARVETLLGEGGQGAVYRVRLNDRPFALKWYNATMIAADPGLWTRLRKAVDRGAPSDRFLWPFDLVTAGGRNERFGYLMRLRGEQYAKLTALIAGEAEASFRAIARTCFNLADAFSALSDKRAYKAAMSGEEALATMRAMPGHFEPRLLDAFAPIALSVKR